MEICKEMGLEIVEEPRERSKSGLKLEEYKARQEEEKAREAARRAAESRGEAEKADRRIKTREKDLAAAEAKLEAVEDATKANLDLKINKMEKKKGLFQKKSKDDPFVTVVRRVYDEVSEAGEKAADRLQAASQKEKAIAEREARVAVKEREIEPMYEKAAANLARTQWIRDNQEREIREKATNLFNDFVVQEEEREREADHREIERYRRLMKRDGILDIYDAEIKKEKQAEKAKRRRAWEHHISR